MKSLLLAASLAAGALASPIARHFKSGWTKIEAGALPPAPTVHGLRTDLGQPARAAYNVVTHIYLTRQAYRLYASRYDCGELARYIGGIQANRPSTDEPTNVIAGSYDEDIPFENPWSQLVPELRHFWDYRKGRTEGFAGYDSSVDRAYKYFTGGFGYNGRYDDGWSHGGQRGAGAVALYKSGNKALAFWYLGHASHLLEDLSVPAHALLWPHPVRGVDAYETFIGKRVSGWPALDGEPVERFNTLYDLFLRTGQVSAGFDAGYGPGPMEGVDGTRDRGRRRAEGFPRPALLQEESVLIPLAIRRIAALFRLFYAQVDHAPPTVSLRVLRRGRRARLTALARDAQSGVDRRGFRFQYRLLGTRPWREASAGPTGPVRYLPLRPQAAYAFRVRAVDSVGNAAYSPIVVSLPRTRPALLAVR